MSDHITEQLEETQQSRTTADTATSTSSVSKTGESRRGPPGWRELSQKAVRKTKSSEFSAQTLGFLSSALAIGFGTTLLGFSIPGGWFTAIFLVSALGGVIGKDNLAAAGVAGGAITGISTFLGGVLMALGTFGLSVGIGAVIGVAIGIAGAYAGRKITN